MRYLLHITVLENIPDIEISADEYNKLESAQKILANAQAIEVKYDIMISNFLELEKQILQNTAIIMVRNVTDYPEIFKIRQSLTIQMVNLLTSAKLYHDQLFENVSNCIPNSMCPKESVKGLFEKEWHENIKYRFMEALRDYVQHRGLPIRWTKHNMRWTTSKEDDLLEYNIEFGLGLSELKADRKFDKRGLDGLNEIINLKSFTRSYVESLSNIHEAIRNIITKSVSEARQLIENTQKRFQPQQNGNFESLCALKITNKGDKTSVPLLLGWDNIRLELIVRNKKLTNLSKRYVTGILKATDEK